MKKNLLLSALVLVSVAAFSQKEDKAIKAVINRFFEGMQKGDTAMIRSACAAAPVFQTYMNDEKGEMTVQTEDFEDFLRFVGTPTPNKYEEKIEFEAIHAEKSLASVWTPYTFWVNGKRSHCGTNSFQLIKSADGWHIQYIIDTRRRQGCE